MWGQAARRVVLALAWVPTGVGAQSAASVDEALTHFEAGQLAAARTAFEALLDTSEGAVAHHYLGRIDLRHGEFGDAEDHLQRAAELEPNAADYHYWLGIAYLEDLQLASFLRQRGLASKAREALHLAVELDPDHVQARLSLGQYYTFAPGIAGGSKERALEQANEIISRDRRTGYLLMAQIYAEKEDEALAVEWYNATRQAYPHDPEVLYTVGMYNQDQELWDDAFAAFEAAAALPVDAETRPWVRSSLYQIGRTAVFSERNTDRAIEALQQFNAEFAEPADELTAGGHWRLGMLYESRGEEESARQAYEDALRIDPDNEEAQDALNNLR
jgi:tetratricopeptide (TPR) repeat protein